MYTLVQRISAIINLTSTRLRPSTSNEMHDKENGNKPRDEDADPPPPDPGTLDPLPTTETAPININGDNSERTGLEEEDSAQADHQQPDPNTVLVTSNGATRRMKRSSANKVTITCPQTHIRNIPPPAPPTKLYHGNQTSVY